jgi:hypothetical protein
MLLLLYEVVMLNLTPLYQKVRMLLYLGLMPEYLRQEKKIRLDAWAKIAYDIYG